MIDLEKTKREIEDFMNSPVGEKISDFNKKYASEVLLRHKKEEIQKHEISQLKKEIESLTSKHGSAIGKLHFTEKKLGEAQQEISEIKAKLAKYESDDVVLIPRIPGEKIKNAIDVAIRKSDREKLYSQDSVSHRKSELVYKAMIEAGEIK